MANKFILQNQYGEISINTILEGNAENEDIGLSAEALTGQPLTGFTVGSNATIAATDTILEAFGKTQGQLADTAITAKVLTGLVAGSNTAISATDTILAALAKLQAQIDAL